jgi:hypothetical protein
MHTIFIRKIHAYIHAYITYGYVPVHAFMNETPSLMIDVVQVPKAGTYFPFGHGPRMCIGNRFGMLEMKCALAHIVRRFSFKLDEARPIVPTHVITLGVGIGKGVFLYLSPRPAYHS